VVAGQKDDVLAEAGAFLALIRDEVGVVGGAGDCIAKSAKIAKIAKIKFSCSAV
jgi:hypothetical protein